MKLEEIIKNFRLNSEKRDLIINGDNVKEESNKDEYVPEPFKKIAKCILSGHFKVTEGNKVVRRVYPTCVEIYYHEEAEDAIKDYIVYHRNKGDKSPGIFCSGSFNTHQSGIDITFEHRDHNGNIVRASALIREYKMVDERIDKEGSPLYVKNKKVDNRSTYLYEALFADLSIIKGFSIQWVDGEDNGEKDTEMTAPTYRKNVLPHNEKGKIEKDKDGKIFKNDGRCWQFSRKD